MWPFGVTFLLGPTKEGGGEGEEEEEERDGGGRGGRGGGREWDGTYMCTCLMCISVAMGIVCVNGLSRMGVV